MTNAPARERPARSVLRGLTIVFSTIASISLVGLAYRSYAAADVINVGGQDSEVEIICSLGRVQVTHDKGVGLALLGPKPGRLWSHQVLRPAPAIDWLWPVGISKPQIWNFGGGLQLVRTPIITIPLWVLTCLLLLPAVKWIVHRARHYRRVENGRCAQCGYDLRMSGLTCPECGAS